MYPASSRNEILLMMRCLIRWLEESHRSLEGNSRWAFIVEKYNGPMPKVRSSKVEVNGKENPLSSGTLETPQLKQILLLHAGKSEEHSRPMSIESIAEKFEIDPAQVKNILRFVSLPPEKKVNEMSESHRDI